MPISRCIGQSSYFVSSSLMPAFALALLHLRKWHTHPPNFWNLGSFLPVACLLDPFHLRVSSEESAFHFAWVLLLHTISVINTIIPAQATIFSPVFILPHFPHTGIVFLKCSSDYVTLLHYPSPPHPPWPPSEIRIKSKHLMVAEKTAMGPHLLPCSLPITLSLTHSPPSFPPSGVFPVLPLD